MDDEVTVREVLGSLLGELGYDVMFAKDGQEAIEQYKHAKESGRPFDAVIMDLTIPGGMGGKETISILREFDPQIKAIVSSGYSTDPIMSEFKKYGFKDVIPKPYRIQDLRKILNNVLKHQEE